MTTAGRSDVRGCGLVVIPAASEAKVIARAIDTVDAQDFEGRLVILIVVNGSIDGTGEVARAAIRRLAGNPLREWVIVEMVERSKPGALNLGDRTGMDVLAKSGAQAPDFFIYLDADVELSQNAIGAMAHALRADHARLVQPQRCEGRSDGALGRLVGRALCALPWIADDVVCGGVYAVNRPGRDRWREFPEIGADDAYVFGFFDCHERKVIRGAWATHPMPSTIAGLLRQQRRWREARRELNRSAFRPAKRQGPGSAWPPLRRIRALLGSPRLLAAAVLVRLIRIASLADSTPFTSHSWEVDRGVGMNGVRRAGKATHSSAGRP